MPIVEAVPMFTAKPGAGSSRTTGCATAALHERTKASAAVRTERKPMAIGSNLPFLPADVELTLARVEITDQIVFEHVAALVVAEGLDLAAVDDVERVDSGAEEHFVVDRAGDGQRAGRNVVGDQACGVAQVGRP
jgi:hypothetical protein